MMSSRSYEEPRDADAVIWAACGLLALVLGLGAAFSLWAMFRASLQPSIPDLAVGSLGLGLLLLGAAMHRPTGRVFLIVFAAVLLLGYAFGGAAFNRLIP
jgi:hypothetical protein